MKEPHTIQKGYYFNYMFDAAQLYWAARWLELNPSTEVKDKMLDELMIRRLRSDANSIIENVKRGIDNVSTSISNELKLDEQLNVTD